MRSVLTTVLTCFLLLAGVAYSQEPSYDQLMTAIAALELDTIKASQEQLEQTRSGFETQLLLAIVYSFWSDYYNYFVLDSRTARPYADRTIAAAEQAIALEPNNPLPYVFVAEGYANKLTGAISALRFGGRLNSALDEAAAVGEDNPHWLFLQSKRYLLAPALFGGDRAKAAAGFQRLVDLYPGNSVYYTFLGESLRSIDPDAAIVAFQQALLSAPANTRAKQALTELE